MRFHGGCNSPLLFCIASSCRYCSGIRRQKKGLHQRCRYATTKIIFYQGASMNFLRQLQSCKFSNNLWSKHNGINLYLTEIKTQIQLVSNRKRWSSHFSGKCKLPSINFLCYSVVTQLFNECVTLIWSEKKSATLTNVFPNWLDKH